MTSQAFRFIHASDFHLEAPVDGLIECPERLENVILDAPRAAVERFFTVAINEKVDFVVLSGDLISPRDAGPWGMIFLIEQFEKLAAEHIPVYWAAGKSDSPDLMPAAFRFPENVHIFPVGSVEELFFTRDGVPIARIFGTSFGKTGVAPRGAADSSDAADDVYTIGVFNGQLPPEALKNDTVRYWALGGARVRETVSRSPSLAVYPGSTLARNFEETGDFGAILIEVAESGRTTTIPVRTSPLRWSVEHLTIRADESEEEILNEARSRLKAIQEKSSEEAAFAGRDPSGDLRLVSWRVDADESALVNLRYGNLTQTILRDLRADFGKTAPIVYAVDFLATLPEKFSDDLYERQTILGDYLRMVRFYMENPDDKIDVEIFFPEELRDWAARERLKRELESRRRTEGETPEILELSAKLQALETKEFRADVPTLFDLLAFESVEASEPESAAARRAARRIAALREATALGVDLLSETDVGVVSTGPAKGALKKNRDVLAELRNLQKNVEGKESLS
ncbi:MAG: metallophosphoesterase [Thermoguttaceae bacterium]|nr:metallophosphoesterase [Thermoguttaceae bacterium]